MALPRLSPRRYSRWCVAALTALIVIVVSGAAVRLTGSGLGCPDWPTCADGKIVAPLEGHAMIEFANRVFTGVVALSVIAAVAGSLLRTPKRRDLTLLSLGLVAGVLAQIIIGGVVVLAKLQWQAVVVHFLASMVLVANATVLVVRSRWPDNEAVARPAVASPAVVWSIWAARAAVVFGVVALLSGTIVTSAGPHAGDPDTPRLDVPLGEVAQLHSGSVWFFVAMLVIALWKSRLVTRAQDLALRRSMYIVAIVGCLQGAIGYVQYFTGVPALLVGFHILGASLFCVAITRVWVLAGVSSTSTPTSTSTATSTAATSARTMSSASV